MNQSSVSERLWKAIASNYESGDYKGAILDGMQVVTDVLREKSAVDGDGGALVGQALGGENPKLRLNALSTTTEKDLQKGFEQILRGMYLAVRNPRTHEAKNDERKTADAILIFIDHLLSTLVASSESFTMSGFMAQVLDADFVDTQRYAELLVASIPPLHLGEALWQVFEQRRHIPLMNRKYLLRELTAKLSDAQMTTLYGRVSNEMKGPFDEAGIRTYLQVLRPDDWSRIDEAPRLRLEHKLIAGIRGGEIRSGGKVHEPLATWCGSFLKNFQSKSEVATVLSTKLNDTDKDDRRYVARFFFYYLPGIDESEAYIRRCTDGIIKALKGNDEHIKEALIRHVNTFPETWTSRLVEGLAELTDKDNPAIVLKDGTPLLKAAEKSADPFDDDIPF